MSAYLNPTRRTGRAHSLPTTKTFSIYVRIMLLLLIDLFNRFLEFLTSIIFGSGKMYYYSAFLVFCVAIFLSLYHLALVREFVACYLLVRLAMRSKRCFLLAMVLVAGLVYLCYCPHFAMVLIRNSDCPTEGSLGQARNGHTGQGHTFGFTVEKKTFVFAVGYKLQCQHYRPNVSMVLFRSVMYLYNAMDHVADTWRYIIESIKSGYPKSPECKMELDEYTRRQQQQQDDKSWMPPIWTVYGKEVELPLPTMGDMVQIYFGYRIYVYSY